jgi:hypothetical protein
MSAVEVDGFIVVSNFSRGPTTIQLEHNSSVYTIPINGRGTRVVPVN